MKFQLNICIIYFSYKIVCDKRTINKGKIMLPHVWNNQEILLDKVAIQHAIHNKGKRKMKYF